MCLATAAAILHSLQSSHSSDVQKIKQTIKYHEMSCRQIYLPDVPQQQSGNSCGLFCFEYIRQLNKEILHDIFNGIHPQYGFNYNDVERYRPEYVDILKQQKPNDLPEVRINDSSMDVPNQLSFKNMKSSTPFEKKKIVIIKIMIMTKGLKMMRTMMTKIMNMMKIMWTMMMRMKIVP